jgi:two-component system, NarL family, response regulator DevR
MVMLQRGEEFPGAPTGNRVVVLPTSRRAGAPYDARTIRVFIVDAHEVTRRGVTSVLEADPGIRVVGEASSSDEALRRSFAVRPDVAVVETPELCERLRAAVPLPCLVLTQDVVPMSAGSAVRAGAAGLLGKDVSSADLVTAVRRVAAGKVLFAPATVAAAGRDGDARSDDRLTALTPRERQLLRLLGHGLTNRGIATRLGLTEKTVKNYVTRLLAKLGLENRTQAAVLATRLRRRG